MRTSLLIGLVFCSTLAARAGSGGSVYSIFGIGDIQYLPSATSQGMGYTGIGLPSAATINSMQPASWARINRVRVDAGLLYEGFKSSDADKSVYLANTNFNGALLAIPISTDNGIVTVLGFTPYSDVNYSIFVRGIQEGIDYQLNNSGSGGVSRGLAGLSYSPLPDLSFGASFNYLFGTIDNSTTFSPDNTTLYTGAATTQSVSLHGITVSMGGMFNGFGRISESLKPFSLGFVLTTRGNLKSDTQTEYDFLLERDTITAARGTVTIPVAFGIGLGYQPTERHLIAVDYYAQQWGKALFSGIDPPEIRNSYRLGIGAEQVPLRDAHGWFARLVYRLGFSYHSTYYQVNSHPINEWVATAGLGMPLFGDARLNSAFEYGSRGTTQDGLVKSKVFRVTFSISLSETWFQRYEED